MTKRLNLGCGHRFHPQWINMDLYPASPGVIAHDLRKGIPLAEGECDAVYHSHVLEHLPPEEGRNLLRECWRVLKPGGIVRVVVPDLEGIARQYLAALDHAANDPSGANQRYDWMMLELFDQTVREQSGGQVLRFLREEPSEVLPFVLERWGAEAKGLIDRLRATPTAQGPAVGPNRWRLGHWRHWPKQAKESLTRWLLGSADWQALQTGRFRGQGEIHRWMYDRYSLGRLLTDVGFMAPKVCTASESGIESWRTFALDIDDQGHARKPDSLFIEATKPAVVAACQETTQRAAA
ncbi:MAG: methyltransferase domain-containing protein [Phycisphaeraceae bacterium]|nr:methyltransferase domain-containing protein [Phycisphaeraceae bacterium]